MKVNLVRGTFTKQTKLFQFLQELEISTSIELPVQKGSISFVSSGHRKKLKLIIKK